MHTRDQMGYTLEALAIIGKMLGALPPTAATHATVPQRLRYLVSTKAAGLLRNGLPFVRHEIETLREIRRRQSSVGGS